MDNSKNYMILNHNVNVTVGARNLMKIRQMHPTVVKNQIIEITQIQAFQLKCNCTKVTLECDNCNELYTQPIGRLYEFEERIKYCGKCILKNANEKMKKTVTTKEYRLKKSEDTKDFYQTDRGKYIAKETGRKHSEWIRNNPELIEKWTLNLKHFSGKDHPNWNPNKTKFKEYSSKVRILTEKNYENNIKILNPNNYKRTLCGIDGGYQLDHIKSIKYCFDNDISIEECSDIKNLQLLPWKLNRSKGASCVNISTNK